MGGRTIVIGDVHGCIGELEDLLQKVNVRPSDKVVFVGDLVDRGPDSAAVVALAMQHMAIRGNHEDSLLKRRARGTPIEKMRPDHARTYKTLSPEQFQWLEQLPLYLELPDIRPGGLIVVHGGLVPDVPLPEQDPNFLLRGQMLAPPDNRWGYYRPTKQTWWPGCEPESSNARFWAEVYRGPQTVVFGHTVFSAPLALAYAYGIDTGCVFGGELTALVLPDHELVSVPAQTAYWPERTFDYRINDVWTSAGTDKKSG